MSVISEYTYEPKRSHLDQSEALNEYKRALKNHPDALVVLDDLDCGHWNVVVLKTAAEKNRFYRRRLNSLYKLVSKPFRKLADEHEIG